MKKIILISVMLALSIGLFGKPINLTTAQKVAEMKLQIEEKSSFEIDDVYKLRSENEKILSYVFHLEPKGFIAISTDSDIAPIISYSFRNNFIPKDIPQNIGYQMLKTDMKLRLQAISKTDKKVTTENNLMWERYLNEDMEYFGNRSRSMYPPEGSTPTGGWVETQWHQSYPYNMYCPIDPGYDLRSVTGCVATAMAQIIHYHRFIGDVSFSDYDDYYSTYTSPYIYIDNNAATYDFPTWGTLNSYLGDVTDCYETADEFTEHLKGTLNYACGTSVDMGYSYEGSGSHVYYCGYQLRNRFDFDTAVDCSYNPGNTTLQNNMIDAQPAMLGVIGTPEYGHAIICDGYNEGDGTFHLNYGWGGNSDGWYDIPSGMPGGFNTVTSACVNIEGGTVPFVLSGWVNDANVDPEGTYITFEGLRDYDCYAEASGYFEFPYMHDGTYLATAVLELDGGGYFYKQKEIYVDANNSYVQFDLEDYEFISGTVSGAGSLENCFVAIYQNEQILTSGYANSDGDFSIPGLLPGDYIATASLSENYFDSEEITITTENNPINFVLEEYPYETTTTFAGDPTGTFQLIQSLSCGIRLADEDLSQLAEDVISKIRFMIPFDPADGQIFTQMWNGEILISETEITGFSEGSWTEIIFENFSAIDTTNEYYVGYRIERSSAGPAAYHDDGPIVEGKGAFIKTVSTWIELNPIAFDFNFCIEAITISQNTDVIYGDVNGDANVTSYDAALTLQYSAGLISGWTENQIIAGDVNGDENISSYDAALILQYSAGIIEEFPVESGI